MQGVIQGKSNERAVWNDVPRHKCKRTVLGRFDGGDVAVQPLGGGAELGPGVPDDPP